MKATLVQLQLSDRLIRKPKGIFEVILVQIDKLYYSVDFLRIDTHSKVDLEFKVPLIIGRAFLTTANVNINYRNGLMNLTFGNMTLEVNIFHVGRKPQVEEVSNCDSSTLVDTFEKDEEFELLIAQSLDSFSFDDFFDDCLYHDASNSLSSYDKVQVEIFSSWIPHDELPTSFRVDA